MKLPKPPKQAWEALTWKRAIGVVIVLMSFAASAGANVDLALSYGLHRWTALALPWSMEATIVLAAIVWHEEMDQPRTKGVRNGKTKSAKNGKLIFAQVSCVGFVAVTWVVNYAHGGQGRAGALAGMVTLSLVVGLHLAFDISPRRRPSTRSRSKPVTRPKTPPATTVASGLDPETADIVQRYLTAETGRSVHDTQLVEVLQDAMGVSRATAYRRLRKARTPVSTNGHGS